MNFQKLRSAIFIVAILIIAFPQWGHPREVLHIFDTQSAVGGEKGSYTVHLSTYKHGGILVRTGISINRFIHLGIMEFVDGLLGSGENRWHIPGIYGKVSVLNHPEEGWNLAFGWDVINNGSILWYEDSPVYGPHVVLTKGFFLGAQNPHIWNVGSKMALTHSKREFFPFTSVYFRIVAFLDYGIEIDNITFRENAKYHFINNHLLSFNITDHFSIQFIFQMGINVYDIRESHFRDYNGRNLTLTYQNQF